MKRKKLEKAPAILATDEMMQIVETDKPKRVTKHYEAYDAYKHYVYFRAAVLEDGILQVAVFFRKELDRGDREPHFYIFIDKTNRQDATYEVKAQKWRTATIENIMYDVGVYEYGMCWENIPYADQETMELVNGYFGHQNTNVKQLIRQEQVDYRGERLKKKHRRETDQIDEAMARVPDLPKDFEEWANEYGMSESHKIVYHAEIKRKKKPAVCTKCGKDIEVESPRRGETGHCPECGKKAELIPWKSKALSQTRTLALIQRTKDGEGWAVRVTRTTLTAYRHDDWRKQIHVREIYRTIYSADLERLGEYEWGQYKSTGIDRWCNAGGCGGYYYYMGNYGMNEARMYWKNLKKDREGTVLRYIPIEDVLQRRPERYYRPKNMMYALRKFPEIEYLIKMGMYNLSANVLDGSADLREGKRPWEVLGIKKEQVQDVIEWDVDGSGVAVLRRAADLGYRLDREEYVFFREYLRSNMEDVIKFMTPHKAIKYMKGPLGERLRDMGNYLDYLRNAERLGWDMKNEMILFPKDFRKAHDEASAEWDRRQRKIKSMEMRRQDRAYKKMLPELKRLYEYQDKDFIVKIPENREDFRKEGQDNHNCVGGYFELVVNKRCVVAFLRRKNKPNRSFCTVEITNVADIRQLWKKSNLDPPEEAKKFAKKWMKEVERRMAAKKAKEAREQNKDIAMMA